MTLFDTVASTGKWTRCAACIGMGARSLHRPYRMCPHCLGTGWLGLPPGAEPEPSLYERSLNKKNGGHDA